MKIIKSIFVSLLCVPFFVFAQNKATLPNAGLTPESPFYFIDKLGEALREFFTFNPEGKARLQITFAAERVAEIKVILETKGVEAKGLEVAQARLQEHLGDAAEIVVKQKNKGKDVSKLTKELDDKLETSKSALADSFKAKEQALETKEDELKARLKVAHRAGDTEKAEAIAQELGQVKAQKELLELKEEDIEDALEAEEEKLEEEIETQQKAEKAIQEAEEAIKEAEEEKQEVLNEARKEKENEEEAKDEEEQEEEKQPQQKGVSTRLETKTAPGLKNGGKQQLTIAIADQFSTLENELLEAKASGSNLAPAHYERITQDLVALESKGYPANEIGRLREITLKLAPHLQDQQKIPESVTATPPPAAPPPAPPPASQPVLKNLGVSFEPWDKNTNRAGAFLFLPAENKLFLEYGAEVSSSEGGTKILPTLEYRTAADADVFAAMDGIVTKITYEERTQDYSIHIQPELNSEWVLEHDHVSNLKVSKGDTVKAENIIGKTGTLGGELGRTEIMFWGPGLSSTRINTYCPFKYFAPELLSEYQQKVLRHMKDWEEFKGNQNLYSEEKHIFSGCVYESLLD